MAKVRKTQVERRAESDARIIQSAMKCFGEKGYTNTTFVQIAKGAGVTQGLLVQRFETKENLLTTVYKYVMHTYFKTPEGNETARECLIKIVEEIKLLHEKDMDAFLFLRMLHHIYDTPEKKKEETRRLYEQSSLKNIMDDAKKKGMLPECDTYMLIRGFILLVFDHIDICTTYGIPCPNNEVFLDLIYFKDSED